MDKKFEDIQEFALEYIEKSVDLEREREKSNFESSNRLLVAQTLLITALFAVLPLLVNKFSDSGKIYFVWGGSLIASLTILSSLFVNLLTQWRFKYKAMPAPAKFENFVESHREVFDENIAFIEAANFMKNMYKTIRSNNDRRAITFNVSLLIMFLATIRTSILLLALVL